MFWFFLVAAAWHIINGILHDVFVILKHEGGYDKELLRLLMNGHVLIFSGVIYSLCAVMQKHQINFSNWLAILTALFMLIYCGMIFPFLKSFGTILVNLILLIFAIKVLLSLSI